MKYVIWAIVHIGMAVGLGGIGRAYGYEPVWLSWVPGANLYRLGIVGDHGRKRPRRLRYLLPILAVVTLVGGFFVGDILLRGVEKAAMAVGLELAKDILTEKTALLEHLPEYLREMTPEMAMTFIRAFGKEVIGPLLLLGAAYVAFHVCLYVGLYRVYRVVAPAQAVVFTVLSVLFTGIAVPVILVCLGIRAGRQADTTPPTTECVN